MEATWRSDPILSSILNGPLPKEKDIMVNLVIRWLIFIHG